MALVDSYSRLKAFKDNFPDKSIVSSVYVLEYHDIVNDLEKDTGLDLLKYRITNESVAPLVTSANWVTGEKTYSSEKFCKAPFFKMKIDGLLNRFTFPINDEAKKEGSGYRVGFRKEE